MFKKKIKVFDSLDTLLILRFWKIINDDNIKLLDVDYKEGKKYSKKDIALLEKTWENIQDDYFDIRTDSKSKMDMEKSFDGLKVIKKLIAFETAIKSLKIIDMLIGLVDDVEIYEKRKELYDNLQKVNKRVKFNHFFSLEQDKEYFNKFYSSLQNTYNLNFKKKEKNDKEQVRNVYTVVANMESWLDGRTLDLETMVVARWIAYEEQVIQKQKNDAKHKENAK